MAQFGPSVLRASAVMILVLLSLSAFGLVHTAAASTTNGFDFTGYLGPPNVQSPTYTATPSIPSGWVADTNTTVGYLTNDGTGAWGTANGTSYYVGTCVFGACGEDYAPSQTIEPFTAALSPLNNNGVPCGSPYATVFALAAATLNVPSSTTMYVDFEMDDGAALYIAPASNMTWTSLFASTSAYNGGGIRPYGANIDLTAGTYLVVIEWYNSCGEGAIAAQFSGLPAGASFTPSPYLSPVRGGLSSPSSCSSGGYCSTAAVVFSTDGTGGATVTLSAVGSQTLVGTTSSSASTTGICSLPVNGSQFGCLAGETGQFIVVTGVNYDYTVTLSSQVIASGTFTVTTPRSVQLIDITVPV